MPRALELRVIDGAVWAKLPELADDGCVFLWTLEEKKEVIRHAVYNFCSDLASKHITDNHLDREVSS